MTKYHISPKTGNPNICRAKPGNCPLKSEDGREPKHYSSKDEARAGFEEEMAQKELQKTQENLAKQKRREEAKEKAWPTPSDEKIKDYIAKGYKVDTKNKTLSLKSFSEDGAAKTELEYSAIGSSLRGDIQLKGSSSRAVSISSNFREIERKEDGSFKFKGPDYDVRFGDYGTRLSIEDAKNHLKEMNIVNREYGNAQKRINRMIEDSEKLFGRPSDDYPDDYVKERYLKFEGEKNYDPNKVYWDLTVNNQEIFEKRETPNSPVEEGRTIIHKMDNESDSLINRNTFRVTGSNDPFNKKNEVEINMNSTGSSDESSSYESYRKRMEDLADAIVDAGKMKDYLDKLYPGGVNPDLRF